MRCLQFASRYQVQLGWLRVIAASIGDGRMSIEEVAEVLLSHRDRFNSWWEETGMEGPARGIAQPATANRAARIGVTYGIHDPDSGQLTALGQVLRHAVPWRRSESPLVWKGGARWLGLWLIMSAAGDVLLSVLRRWPEGGIQAEEAPDFLASVMRSLAEDAAPDARRQLLDQAGRAGGKLRFARNFLIYPYLEPLRDLGYLRAAGKAGGYQLTGEGARLRAQLSDARSATEWLEDGLHKAFLAAGKVPVQPLAPAALAGQLQALPPMLGAAHGADLLPLLLLTQARLSEPCADAAVLELRTGRDLLTEAAARSGGRLRLEGDRLQWSELSADLWQTPSPALTPQPTTAIAAPATEQTSGARFWLQATAALLQPPSPGAPLCWGGPRTALHRLQQWLTEGSPRESAPLDALQSALSRPHTGGALLRRVLDRWHSELPDEALLATLRRAIAAANADRISQLGRLKDNLAAPDAIALTTTLLGDALAVDGWRREELRGRLCQRIAALGDDAGAAAFLDDLAAAPTEHTYVRLLDRALPTGRIDGVEITDGPSGQRQAWLTLTAPCPAAAMRAARKRVDAAIAVCCYAARVSLPTSAPSETLSPPLRPPAAVPDWLLLPVPDRPVIPMQQLGDALLPLASAVATQQRLPAITALAEAAALAGIREGLVALILAAEEAVHRIALANPGDAVLDAIARWRGDEDAAAYRELSTIAPLLRPLKRPHPTPRSPAAALALLDHADPVVTVTAESYPWLAARLERWAAMRTDAAAWAAEATARREHARQVLAQGVDAQGVALLDPVIAEAGQAIADGTPLAMHWGAVLDRFDDLTTLAAPPSASRLSEILGLKASR